MTRTVKRGARTGSVDIISSKSYAHRLIILASLAKSASNIECRGTSKDIEATISCMNALGANIARTGDTIHIEPITAAPEGVCELHCGESGSTLRFLLPIVGALGAEAIFIMEAGWAKGRLPRLTLCSARTAWQYKSRAHGSAARGSLPPANTR